MPLQSFLDTLVLDGCCVPGDKGSSEPQPWSWGSLRLSLSKRRFAACWSGVAHTLRTSGSAALFARAHLHSARSADGSRRCLGSTFGGGLGCKVCGAGVWSCRARAVRPAAALTASWHSPHFNPDPLERGRRRFQPRNPGAGGSRELGWEHEGPCGPHVFPRERGHGCSQLCRSRSG